MPRATNAPASRRRRKRRLELAKGYYGNRSKAFRMATEAVDRAMVMAYAHRKQKKVEYRSLWIARLSAYGISRADFPRILDKSNNKNSPVTLDRGRMQAILEARV